MYAMYIYIYIYACIPSNLHTYTWQITHTHILVFDKTKCHNPSSELMTKHYSWIPHLLAAPKHMSSGCDHRPSSKYLGCWKLLNSANLGIVIVTYLLDLYARVKLVSGTVDCKGNHLLEHHYACYRLPDVPSQSYSHRFACFYVLGAICKSTLRTVPSVVKQLRKTERCSKCVCQPSALVTCSDGQSHTT